MSAQWEEWCQVGRELGIPQPTFNRWRQQAATAPLGAKSFLATEELKVVRRELEQVRMERDIVKKAGVGSGGACNSCLQYSRRRLKPQCLPRTLIQP